MIAMGLYLGLRRDPPSAPSTPPTTAAAPPTASGAPASSAAPPASTAAPAIAPSAAPAPSSAPSARAKDEVDADVAKAIEQLKQRTAKECYAPVKGQPGVPATVKFIYSGSFDPKGDEVARGISEDRTATAPKVAACLRAFKMDLKIPAPGAYVNVNVPFEVP
ncbi:MAG: hypothetical protein U0414_32195 [Polyangiaceae bacterium]